MKIIVPDYIEKLMNKINKLGYDVYLVGGYIRDTLLNIECNDYDLVTTIPLEKLRSIIPNLTLINENQNNQVVVAKINDMIINISSMYNDNILKDLSNRDFTINSMCANASGNIIDPYNGTLDLKYRKIRLIDEEGNSLKKDPIRILRAIRLANTLNFDIDSETYNLLLDNKELLNKCANKRIFVELSKILMCDKPGNIISDNREIITTIIPELIPMIDFKQDNPYHIYDVFSHTMEVLNNTKSNLTLRLAALFHDAGKPYCKTVDSKGIGHFLGHQKYSIEEFKKFSKRMHISFKKSKEIVTMIYYHDMMLGTKESSINKFLNKYDYDLDLLFDLKVADIKGQNPDKIDRINEIEELRGIYKEHFKSNSHISNKDFDTNGYTLQKKNYQDKKIDVILDADLSKVLCDKSNKKQNTIENYD